MPVTRTPAIVLKTYDFAEADRILVLFTEAQGRLRAVAKGVRRLHSRLAGSAGWLVLSELQLSGGEHRDLFLVTQGQTMRAYPRLKCDLVALGRAARMAELVLELTPERQPLPECFTLLVSALEALEAGLGPALVGIWFELVLLDRLGYRPDLAACQVCGAAEGEAAFHADLGGLACRACRPGHGVPLTRGARALGARLLAARTDGLRSLRLSGAQEAELSAALEAAVDQQLGRRLKSDTFRRAVAEALADRACAPGTRAPAAKNQV
jgi:DNA repair protein RecO (recombination protein O)